MRPLQENWAALMPSFTSSLWVRKHCATIPSGWQRITLNTDGASYRKLDGTLTATVSGARELDGKHWLHLSIANHAFVPSHQELRDAKFAFFGDRKAIQVFPSSEHYINIHPFCLHLFCCLGADPLPEFSRGSGSL